MKRGIVALCLVGAMVLGSTGCGSVRKRVQMKKGHESYKHQKYDQAIEEYKKVLAIDPDDWDANYYIAMSNMAMYHPGSVHPKDQGVANEAIKYLEKLLQMEAPSDQEQAKVEKYYLSLLTSAEKSDKAIAYLEGQLKKDPKNLELISQIANLYAKKGDFPNALKYFQQRASLEPKNKEAWYTIGVICWERSYRGGITVSDQEREMCIREGMQALDKALQIDPEYFEAISYKNLMYREQAKLLYNQQKYDESQKAIEAANDLQKRALELRKKQAQSGSGA
ncbi:MAG: tetratricopeptide repeat protein [Acidobacteria bacterium]|nr:tetratricopeptide repeat protein [Acidobacteriota bacterium]